jgi:2-oxoglutarate ferredoxin oxidoreductase subunit delta
MATTGIMPTLATGSDRILRRPLDDTVWRSRLPCGQVHLIPDRCKGCKLCIEFCPQQVLVQSTATNAKGYHYPVVAPGKQDACVVCGFCSLICPEFAIFATEIDLVAAPTVLSPTSVATPDAKAALR